MGLGLASATPCAASSNARCMKMASAAVIGFVLEDEDAFISFWKLLSSEEVVHSNDRSRWHKFHRLRKNAPTPSFRAKRGIPPEWLPAKRGIRRFARNDESQGFSASCSVRPLLVCVCASQNRN